MKKLFSFCMALIATLSIWAGNVITYTASGKLPETTSDTSSGLHRYAFNVAISSHTFSNGTGTITFKGDVTSIGDRAFYRCSSLTSITIPNSVTIIGEFAFHGCSGLSSITIPNSVTWIGTEAFCGCSGLTSVTIPNSVTSIGNQAFYGCSGLTSITIPNSVTRIGFGAFLGCSGLTSITIPNSVTSIGWSAFEGCSGLTSIVVESGNTNYDSRDNCNAIIKTSTNTLIAGCKNTVIPNSVTSIGGGAFSGCSSLTTITIPNSVTSIAGSAFDYCSGLTSIVVESGNTNYDSRDNCNAIIETSTNTLIAGCKNTVIPNSVTSIGGSAFYGCSSLTSITIPNSVTSIGYAAFSGCSGLTSIVVESGNTNYDSRENCNAIIEKSTNTLIAGCKNTVIPNSVTSIGDQAFSGCSNLTSITIPNSVTSIGWYAFDGCSGLSSITISNSVTSIGYAAFRDCSSLTSITCEAVTPPSCAGDCFYLVNHTIPLYVPKESVEAYKTAEEWREFTNIQAMTTSLDNTSIEVKATKFFRDGQLHIIRGDKIYTVEGVLVE